MKQAIISKQFFPLFSDAISNYESSYVLISRQTANHVFFFLVFKNFKWQGGWLPSFGAIA